MRHLLAVRRFAAVASLVAGTACGSSPTTVSLTPPPPPSAPGAPAVVIVVTGDGQTAAPGAILPVKLAVQVKDVTGLAIPGATVHFAIDSGGGSLSASSVTTGSDGTASGVTWTLGSSAGTNVVAVTVGTLPAVRFRAQGLGVTARTIFANASVGSGGGTFTYTKAGDALNGLTVTVMPGSYPTGSVWSIVADSSLTVTLPAGFFQVGPTLVINTGQGYSDSTITLTMPMQVGADMAVAPFYYDPASGTLEGIPLVARTATSATLATRHFSADLMAIPGAGAVGSLRATLRQGFGAVRVVWVRIPQAQLVGTFTSSFAPGTDDWEFINYGDYISGNGDCEGMSITAMYYHYFFRLGRSPAPPLYHHYDQSLANQWDNVQGIRFAGSVQGDYLVNWSAGVHQIATLYQQASNTGSFVPQLTSSWIVLTLKLTGRPVLLGLTGPNIGHAVVAYAVRSDNEFTYVSFADPNFPGTPRTMTFDYGLLVPVQLQLNATAAAQAFTSAFALSVTADVPLTDIAARWTEFTQQKAGADLYAKNYHVDIWNPFDTSWTPLTASAVSYSSSVRLRTACTDCVDASLTQHIQTWNAAGSQKLYDSLFTITAGPPVAFNAVEMALAQHGGIGFLDVMPFTIVYQPVSITGPATWDPNVPLAFTVQNPPNVAGAHYKFEWDFGDSPTLAVATDNPNMIHTYAVTGPRTISVAITDLQTGHVIARAGLSNTVGPPSPFIQFDVGAGWDPFGAPPIGHYAYTDYVGPRQAGTATLDALLAEYDRGLNADGITFSNGVTMFVVVPTGGFPTVGQVFTKVQAGQPQAGQFVLNLSLNPSDPTTAASVSPSGTGTLTISSITPVAGGSSIVGYSFVILNATGASIIGSGAAQWK